MLLQVDGSRHDWLQGRGPYLTLVGAVDDATGKVPAALFRQQEDAQGYMLMLKEVIERHGVPLALYSDRHGILERIGWSNAEFWMRRQAGYDLAMARRAQEATPVAGQVRGPPHERWRCRVA